VRLFGSRNLQQIFCGNKAENLLCRERRAWPMTSAEAQARPNLAASLSH
jgi:hypothetical protein